VAPLLPTPTPRPTPKPALEPDVKKRLDAWKEGDAKVKAIQDLGGKWETEPQVHRYSEARKALKDFTDSLKPGDRRKKAVREQLKHLTDEYNDASEWMKDRDEMARKAIAVILKAPDPIDTALTSTIPANAERLRKEVAKGEDWLLPLINAGDQKSWLIESHSPEGWLRAEGGYGRITLTLMDDAGTVVHEIGHCMEDALGGSAGRVGKTGMDYLAYRIKGQPNRKFTEIFPDHGYKDNEEGADDEFGKYFDPKTTRGKFNEAAAWYTGKHYTNRSEIISMGLEALYRDGVMFAKRDPEFCKFIVGILSGDMR
jgi:hypothetical protein